MSALLIEAEAPAAVCCSKGLKSTNNAMWGMFPLIVPCQVLLACCIFLHSSFLMLHSAHGKDEIKEAWREWKLHLPFKEPKAVLMSREPTLDSN